jgi:hypothetical protein
VDEHKPAYKYPFNAADVLSGENTYLLDKFFEDSNVFEEDRYEELDEEGEKAQREINEDVNETSKPNELEKNLENANETKEIMDEINEVVEKIQNIELHTNEESKLDDNQEKFEETKKDSENDIVENVDSANPTPQDENVRENSEEEIIKKIESEANSCENANENGNTPTYNEEIANAQQEENCKVEENNVANENNQNKLERVKKLEK